MRGAIRDSRRMWLATVLWARAEATPDGLIRTYLIDGLLDAGGQIFIA